MQRACAILSSVACPPLQYFSILSHKSDFFLNTGCPTRYRSRHFFNNSNPNEDIAMKFEKEYFRCVRNEKECVCSVCL